MDSELLELAHALGEKLTAIQAKIAVAESCTGGLIAAAITEIPGSSAWFDRGFVTYSNAAKVEMLGVSPETLQQHGAVSAQIARDMAAGVLSHSDAEFSLAVTGVAGPGGGSAEKPVGTVFIAWQQKNRDGIWKKLSLNGDRHSIRVQTAKSALQYYLF
ncbi:MAG: damage-inducible protein CinA [Methylomonas sp.]|nr:MAG: damage-inducible protein CinA [Methylomonas sp.]